jgi:hypothetical protein
MPEFNIQPSSKRIKTESVTDDNSSIDDSSFSEESNLSLVVEKHKSEENDSDVSVGESVQCPGKHFDINLWSEDEIANLPHKAFMVLWDQYVAEQEQQLQLLTLRGAAPLVGNAKQEGLTSVDISSDKLVVKLQSPASQEFYKDENNIWDGMVGLYKKTIFHESAEFHREPMENDLVAKLFLLVKLTWKQSRNNRRNLAAVLGLFQIQSNQEFSNRQSFLGNRNIRKFSDLESLVHGRKFGFIENLPHPIPITLAGPHGGGAYISVIESIAHILRSDNPPPFDCIAGSGAESEEMVSRASQAAFVLAKFDKTVDYHILLDTWSDGFETNYSSKQNRLHAWIKTGTLLQVPKAGADPTRKSSHRSVWCNGTFPIAMFNESKDQIGLENAFYAEMKQLDVPGGMPFYHGRDKKVVRVRVTQRFALGDQPERRKFCGHLSISSNNGPAFGVIGNYKQIHKNLPSCADCLRALLAEKRIIKDCQKCLNWELFREDTALNLYDPPPNFPTEMLPTDGPNKGKLRLQRFSFKLVQEAAETAHQKIVSGHWPNSNTQTAYLDAHALNRKTRDSIIQQANNCKLKKRAVADNDQETLQKIEVWEKEFPDMWNGAWKGPAIWSSGLDIDQVPCIIMHLLFLGMVKLLMEEAEKWLGIVDISRANFSRNALGVLESIKQFNLEWCKLQPYGEGTGGAWVSENYLAFARVMPWFYSMLNLQDKTSKTERNDYDITNKKKWTGPDCEVWLRHRKLMPQGRNHKAAKLQDLVHRYMTADEGPPDRIQAPPTSEQFNLCVQSLVALIARVMAEQLDTVSIEEADCYVRIFLTYFSHFDTLMTLGKNIPAWVSHANCLSLTRLIPTMRKFGPLRLAWEGGISGEGFLRLVKSTLQGGSRSNLYTNTLLRIVRSMALDGLEQSAILSNSLEKIAPDLYVSHHTHKSFHRYPSPHDVNRAFLDNKPISGFRTIEGKHGICVGNRKGKTEGSDSIYFVEYLGFSKKINGWAYHKWKFEHNPGPPPNLSENHIACSVLFLPELGKTGFIQQKGLGIYAVIDDKWQLLNEEKVVAFPSM